jgi:hypothetical protein
VTYIQHQDHGFFLHALALKIWQIFWKKKKEAKFQLKNIFSPKKIPSFCPNKQPKHRAGCKSQTVQDIQICMPMDHIDYFIN